MLSSVLAVAAATTPHHSSPEAWLHRCLSECRDFRTEGMDAVLCAGSGSCHRIPPLLHLRCGCAGCHSGCLVKRWCCCLQHLQPCQDLCVHVCVCWGRGGKGGKRGVCVCVCVCVCPGECECACVCVCMSMHASGCECV
ncbi:unnamed protein product [Closterium sp. NIES-54]